MTQNHKGRCMCVDDDGKLIGVISLATSPRATTTARAGETMRGVSQRETRA
jgi:hypothetical protein